MLFLNKYTAASAVRHPQKTRAFMLVHLPKESNGRVLNLIFPAFSYITCFPVIGLRVLFQTVVTYHSIAITKLTRQARHDLGFTRVLLTVKSQLVVVHLQAKNWIYFNVVTLCEHRTKSLLLPKPTAS